MAIINLELPPATVPGPVYDTPQTGTPAAQIDVTELVEDHTFNIIVSDTAAAEFPFGDNRVRLTNVGGAGTTAGQYIIVVSQHSNTTGPTETITVRILEVLVEDSSTTGNITSFTLENFTQPTGVVNGELSGATDIPTGGFVQAIFTGNELASNADKRMIDVSFGNVDDRTNYPLQVGVAIPAGATISNPHLERFNILLNT